MAKNVTDQPVEMPVDSQVQVPDDWNPSQILTQEDAVRWAKKFPDIKSAFVTQDKNLFTLENIDFGRNHSINSGLKGFTL